MDPINILQNKLSWENIIETKAENSPKLLTNVKTHHSLWLKSLQVKRNVNVYVTKQLTFNTNGQPQTENNPTI
jgi:hypothetical protein